MPTLVQIHKNEIATLGGDLKSDPVGTPSVVDDNKLAPSTLAGITSPVAGQIPFFGTGGTIWENDANFVWDSATGYLGIGTNAPSELLSVSDGASEIFNVTSAGNILSFVTGGGQYLHLRNPSTAKDWLIKHDDNKLHIQKEITTGSEIMTFHESGRVGINTGLASDPKNTLHVQAVGMTSGLGSTPNDRGITISGDASGRSRLYFENIASTSGQRVFFLENNAGVMSFSSLTDSGASLVAEDTLSITYDGNVGIGTSTPGNKLDIVTGNTNKSEVHIGETDNEGGYLTSFQDNQLIISGGSEAIGFQWTARATEAALISLANGNIVMYADSGLTDGSIYTLSERFRVTSAGRVGIGNIAPDFTLDVNGAIGNSSIGQFTDADTTPDVSGSNVFKEVNTGATSITAFDGSYASQIITLIFSTNNTTIVDGTNLHLSGGVNFVGTVDDVLQLVRDGSSWFEVSRSVN